ncbi:MAG: PorT family protein [Bacteroidales bacterium]|nr:PorT family protein [Bacteroidales bacterium]
MRNRLILIFALSLCFLQGFSQKSYFGGGVVFGNTFSAMSADNIPGCWKTGITAGLFGNVKLVDNYNVRMLLQLDMNFTIKGTRSKPNFGVKGLARKDKHSTSLGYIEFPLLLRFRFNSIKTDNDGVWLDLGPSIGFLLYQRTVQRHHISTPAGTGSWGDVWDDYYGLNRFEFSFLAGITYVFKRHHGLSLRFSHSLIPIGTPEQEVTTGILKKHYNSTFYFVYSFQF